MLVALAPLLARVETAPVFPALFAGGFQCCCCSFYLTIIALGIASFAFWIWMLVEVCTKEPPDDKDRVMWILIVVLAHGIGAAIYYFVRRPERKRRYGQ